MKKSDEAIEQEIAAYLTEHEPHRRSELEQSRSGRSSQPLERFKPCFKQTDRQNYDEKFDVLPPLGVSSAGYLVGEPWSHRVCHVTGRYSPTYQALVRRNGKYYQSCEGITLSEWRALDLSTLQVV